jgi:Cft2 family RNA processing exonuclease
VITSRQAFLVDQLVEQGLFSDFDLRSKNVKIFKKEKKTSGMHEKHLEERYGDRVIEAQDVKADQEDVILVASLSDMLALPAIQPMPGSVYILSSSEPFNEEMEISHEKLLGWLTRYGLPLFQVHASGHATAHDLRLAVETIQPKKVFLVHTENAALYAKFLGKLGFETVQPEEGRVYLL